MSTASTDADDRMSSESATYICSTSGCSQKFTNASDLSIHKQKHQMTLKLGAHRAGLTDMLPVDETPTPTKFLQFGKETGLFDDININNPFDKEFRSQTQSKKEKARLSVPSLIISNNKARTPTGFSSAQSQPVHVITLTPTLPSPVALANGQLFIPPIPSPGFLPGLAGLGATSPLAGPAALISPSIVPFSAPGLHFNTMQAVVEAQQAALTHAFMNAAAASQASNMELASTSSIHHVPTASPPFPTQNVSVPVHHTIISQAHTNNISTGQNMASAPVGSASVIQQHGQISMEHQRRALTQSNSMDNLNRPIPSTTERKSSFPGETSVITQTPNSSVGGQMNSNMYQYLNPSQGNMHFTNNQNMNGQMTATRMSTHSVLTASRSVPTPPMQQTMTALQNIQPNTMSNLDAKQKLKETLTNNNPSLQIQHHHQASAHDTNSMMDKNIENNKNQNEIVSSSSGNDSKPRRRGRQQSETDPDKKRLRFLERNRAAASRCRAKKKNWVSGLEVKAKELNVSNITLQNEVASLREEVASLKQLLLAHRDCPITRVQQQKLIVAGADPSVVADPIQVTASLFGGSSSSLASNDQTTDASMMMSSGMEEDVKPPTMQGLIHQPLTHTSSAGSVGGDNNNTMQMTSVVVTHSMVSKTEPQMVRYPAEANSVILEATNASAIVPNSSYSGSSSLSSGSSTS